jgi:hypothetical protein
MNERAERLYLDSEHLRLTAPLSETDKTEAAAHLAREEVHTRETHALCDKLSPHRAAEIAHGVATHGHGIGKYFPEEQQREILRLKAELENAERADHEVHQSRPGGRDLEKFRSFGRRLSAYMDYCRAIRLAAMSLREAVVRILGALEEPAGCIIDLGNRIYSIGGREKQVTQREDDVLQAFTDAPALSQKDLIASAGFDRAPRVLQKLRERYDGMFAPAITLPRRKGAGGYVVNVRAHE